MFLFIPLGIFLISVVALVWIISRKFVYLKKLAPEVVESVMPEQEPFWAELFPGLAGRIKSSKLREYKLNLLSEFEKILRKLRLFSLKLDTATNQLIHQVRKSVVHHESMITSEAVAQAEQELKLDNANGNVKRKDWREEEHKLILEIAKNPKDAGLYKKLGNIYIRTEEWGDALEAFKRVMALDPTDETIRNKLERVTKKLEKKPE